MAPSVWQLLIVAVIVLVLFGGRGKISSIMGDLGKGLKDFKKNVKEDGKNDAHQDTKITKSDNNSDNNSDEK